MTTPKSSPRRDDPGFTLVELLIVIVILGILATVTVFAVRGITDQGKSSACGQEIKTLETAQESHMAKNGTYAVEADLVTAGFMRAPSRLYDITLASGDYTLTAVDPQCGGTATATTVASATTLAPAGPTIAGLPVAYWGSGTASDPLLLVVAVDSYAGINAEFTNLPASHATPFGYRIGMLDARSWATSPPTQATLQAIETSNTGVIGYDCTVVADNGFAWNDSNPCADGTGLDAFLHLLDAATNGTLPWLVFTDL
jgi:prepilin-type N-terminal cleavage/methylation domain-containing protein